MSFRWYWHRDVGDVKDVKQTEGDVQYVVDVNDVGKFNDNIDEVVDSVCNIKK